ncbi:MAG TPA: GGDEF domain-containing protein, partial [Dyella sp.]|nr:GGDEF domain-containing protein [Dyella sp.]
FGVLNLDIDGLKPINDGLGHRAGDAAIREVATRIKQGSREADTTARVGGDEFSVILTQAGSRDEIRSHTERLSALIGAPFAFESSPMLLAASIGAAIYPDDGEDISTLMESSDRAMYAAKRSGRTGDWIG